MLDHPASPSPAPANPGAPPDRPSRFVRAHGRDLSLWQSAVAAHVRRELGAEATAADVLAHPSMVAVADHVQAAEVVGDEGVQPGGPRMTAAYLSRLGFDYGRAMVAGDTARAEALAITARKYSDDDPNFLLCAVTYADYARRYDGHLKYNDWKVEGGGDPAYGVIPWRRGRVQPDERAVERSDPAAGMVGHLTGELPDNEDRGSVLVDRAMS